MCKACEVVRSVIKPCDVVSVRIGSGHDRVGEKGIVFAVPPGAANGTALVAVVFPDGAHCGIALADLIRVAPAIGC